MFIKVCLEWSVNLFWAGFGWSVGGLYDVYSKRTAFIVSAR